MRTAAELPCTREGVESRALVVAQVPIVLRGNEHLNPPFDGRCPAGLELGIERGGLDQLPSDGGVLAMVKLGYVLDVAAAQMSHCFAPPAGAAGDWRERPGQASEVLPRAKTIAYDGGRTHK